MPGFATSGIPKGRRKTRKRPALIGISRLRIVSQIGSSSAIGVDAAAILVKAATSNELQPAVTPILLRAGPVGVQAVVSALQQSHSRMAFRGWAFGVMDQFVIRQVRALLTIAEQYLSMNCRPPVPFGEERHECRGSAVAIECGSAYRSKRVGYRYDRVDWLFGGGQFGASRADLAASVRR